jgi:hypothetical protein
MPAASPAEGPIDLLGVLALGSQSQEYRRLYAQFTRAAKNNTAPAEVQSLFTGHAKDLFRARLVDNKSWSGATLRLRQQTMNSTEISDEFGYRSADRLFGCPRGGTLGSWAGELVVGGWQGRAGKGQG